MIALLAGCDKSDRTNLPRPLKHLHWTVAQDPETLDTSLCQRTSCLQQLSLTTEGLTRIKKEEGRIGVRPALSEEWSNPTPTQFVFKLRKNVQWSDGEPLQAIHFIRAWKRLLAQAHLSSNAAFLFPIVNARLFSQGKVPFDNVGIRSPDPFTIVIHVHKPSPTLLLALSHPATSPIRDEKYSLPVSVGPFVLERWNRKNDLGYARNSRYYGPPPPLDSIQVKIVPSAVTRIQLFMNGEIDFMDDIPADFIPLVAHHPAFTVFPARTVVALAFNTSKRPFQTMKSRKAFQALFHPGELLKLEKWPHIAAQVTSANQTQHTFETEKISINVVTGTPQGAEIVAGLQAQALMKAGAKLELVSDPTASLSVLEITTNPLHGLQTIENLGSHGRASGVWGNPVFDELLEKARKAYQLEAHLSFLERANSLLEKEAVIFPIFGRGQAVLCNQKVQHISQNPIEIWDFRDTNKN